LVAQLPEESPYRQLDQASWWPIARRTLLSPNRPKIEPEPRQKAA
jgi:hypothetical protein